ncbi:ATP-binding cassette domain-containing protein [Advenella mimigardefordensis]|uniref:ATP-binding protein Uup n=1 Tax=Advenella mimigardefordensis (strain DSM 17166 / LMG 22922 / DPN7) TaxID=1247726 RepID=W0P8K1_ADVMD|nr:ATP-binding cassette domain-containing protein [Advenella mimigardefordensis]AHG63066.1 ABC transporter ATP-binding protein Uup [Advenella mimigardefordensis DPN7]
MAANTLITLLNAQLAFGHHALLDNASLTIQEGERIGLIGRNGAGKSSLLRILDGRSVPDDGEISRLGSLRSMTVEQEPELPEESTVYDTIVGDFLSTEDWQRPTRANMMIEELGLPPDSKIAGLSGGTRKRIALARAFVEQPDLLLLDEPTNHLDFQGIAWLEKRILQNRGACVVITHDRRFLDAITTRIVELDRGKLHSYPGSFSQWQVHKAEWLAAEKLQNERFDKVLAQEEVWIRKGVEARRTRNEGRVKRLEQLRRERSERRERVGNVNFAVTTGERSGKLVAELENVSKSFADKTVIHDYSTTIMRGDRIGIIGPNGAGKTTLLKIILGKLTPDSGQVRLGTNLSVAYFDQMREQLDDNAALTEVINPGSEWVEIGNQRKHVMSYLGDFLFSPARAQSPVSSLSGGERARLLLARLFARPANVLVMDEPTNDLDIETLELLEELLQEFSGTVLLVSHDRTFLNNVITQTIACEGNGQWRDYVGGYDDWLTQRPSSIQQQESASASTQAKNTSSTQPQAAARKENKPGRLSNWEQQELERIPQEIVVLETEQGELTQHLSEPDLYADGPEKAAGIHERLLEIEETLLAKLERWELLESKKGN